MTHKPEDSFIINAGSHYSSEYHRAVTAHRWAPVSGLEWQEAVTEGLAEWFAKCPPLDLGEEGVENNPPEELDGINLPV